MTSLTGIMFKELISHSKLSSQLMRQGVKYLYTREAMGLDGFENTKQRTKSQFKELEDRFKLKMNEFISPESKSLIFTEDLKNMIHLVENDQDLKLVEEMMKKFNSQNKSIRFGSFVFGPVVMRMYYNLNKCDEALLAFKSNELKGMFDQLMSFQILMDLLFKNEKYNEVIEVFEYIKTLQLENVKYPRNSVVLLFGTLYKMNTPESLKLAQDYWKELTTHGHYPLRRAVTFIAALALKQNAPSVALEFITNNRQQNYITIRALKIWALAELGRPDDTLSILKYLLETGIDRPLRTIPQDIFSKLEASIAKINNPDLNREFETLTKQLKENNHIENIDLDFHLLKEIEPLKERENKEEFSRSGFRRNFQRNWQDRPSLRDLS